MNKIYINPIDIKPIDDERFLVEILGEPVFSVAALEEKEKVHKKKRGRKPKKEVTVSESDFVQEKLYIGKIVNSHLVEQKGSKFKMFLNKLFVKTNSVDRYPATWLKNGDVVLFRLPASEFYHLNGVDKHFILASIYSVVGKINA
jgi:hypothetical protein